MSGGSWDYFYHRVERYEDEWGPLPENIARLAFLTPDEAQAVLRGKGDARG